MSIPLLVAMRPRQWVKNVLVLAVPLAAGTLLDADVVVLSAIAFVAFCASASGVYLVNDVVDRAEDRAHPVKRSRPIASGTLRVRLAVTVGFALLVAPVVVLALSGMGPLAAVLAVYAVIQLGYCLWLKHMAVIDLAVVSSGFVLRAIAGGAATGITPSPYFLLVASFGSLFMVAGKRYSEVRLVGEGESATRRSLGEYSGSYLRFVWSMAGAVALVFYCQWAFSLPRTHTLLPQLSIAFFSLSMLRYAVDIDRGSAGEPESIVLGDRVLQVLGALWLLSFVFSGVVG